MAPKIAVFTEDLALQDKAHDLSQRLALPLAEEIHLYDYLLLVTSDYLGIQKTAGKTSPFYFDFASPKFQYRLRHASVKKEIIAKAMGLKASSRMKIIDATAGLARDSFVLASLGFEVIMLERSKIIVELLNDALERTKEDPNFEDTVNRLQLFPVEAKQWLKEHSAKEQPDIIYIDPMFPHRSKSALVKKDMQFFQDLVGEDPDANELLKVALSCATKRVVVKRPRLAEPLAKQKPSFSYTGSSSRFDVYILPLFQKGETSDRPKAERNMQLIHTFLDFILHLDIHLVNFVILYGSWTYAVLFLIIFCETGLVVTPFLPGDSLLFATGALAANADNSAFNIHVLFILLFTASFLGNTVNYIIGKFIGPKVFNSSNSILLNKKHLARAHAFYETYGGKTIIIARFIPIIRTFAPFVAGIGYMQYSKFFFYNVIGALLWVGSLLYASYLFGNLPFIHDHFSTIVMAIIGISILPAAFEILRQGLKA